MDSKEAAELLRKECDSSRRSALRWERMRSRGPSVASPDVCLAMETAHADRIQALNAGAEALDLLAWMFRPGIRLVLPLSPQSTHGTLISSIDDLRAARKENR